MSCYPKLILLFSGKRKSGKDFITNNLIDRLGEDKAVVIRISGPIKSYWAKKNNLPLEDLLSSSSFKEIHRKRMIEWSEEIRNENHGVFCEEAIKMYRASEKPIWIVSDVRRKTDVSWFKENYRSKVRTIRIVASDSVRHDRGWLFTPGIDDVSSECDLDNFYDWDWVFNNDSNVKTIDESLGGILECIESKLKDD